VDAIDFGDENLSVGDHGDVVTEQSRNYGVADELQVPDPPRFFAGRSRGSDGHGRLWKVFEPLPPSFKFRVRTEWPGGRELVVSIRAGSGRHAGTLAHDQGTDGAKALRSKRRQSSLRW
jgi:hypothetical protein